MSATVNVNGVLFDQAHAAISVFDHGFLYGEGIYETLRTYRGRPFLFERHMRRLRISADMIALDVPLTDEQFAARLDETMREAGLGSAPLGGTDIEAYLRILVTRGIGDLSYDLAATPAPSIVVIAKPHVALAEATYDTGVRVAIVPILRNHPGSVNPRIKSNNLLNNALAAQEAFRRGAFEGVMRNYRGELAECTTSNLFIVKDGRVSTPPLESGLLAGITREFLFELGSAAGLSIREAVLQDSDLLTADEAFLTSTTREVVPIVQVDDRSIGRGAPGPFTRRLLAAYRAAALAGAR
jgi:branched-chain amino acid aminotransferase